MGKAIIYARVSTETQSQKGLSIDAQIAKCMEYLQARGMTLADVVIDAVSAKNVSGRPGFSRIMKMINRKEIAHVICWKIDRAFRNTGEGIEAINLMGKRGAQIHVVAEHGAVTMDSADSEFVTTLKLSLAQRERKLVGERTKLALDRKRERGEFCGGEPPYGFTSVDGRLVPNIEEQRVILKIRSLRKKGYSIRRIVVCLTEDGHLNRRGQAFQKTQVARILAREAA
jgi:site-specific DNA recombinase